MINFDKNYQPSSDFLAGKVILVTGAGSGLGRAAAIEYAKHGAQVILMGKTIRNLNHTYDMITEHICPQPAVYPMDFRTASRDHYRNLRMTICKEFQRLDGILHSAVQTNELAPFAHLNQHSFINANHVNVNAPFFVTQAVLPALEKADNASILFTTCDLVEQPKAYYGANAISMHAALGLMGILAAEYADTNIRANAINPGIVASPSRTKAFPAEDPDSLTQIDSVMPAYLYMMGDDSKTLCGRVLKAQ